MSTRIHVRVHVLAAVAFAMAALGGAALGLLGPVAAASLLGLVALVAGLAGCMLQVYALRTFAPRAYRMLVRTHMRGLEALVA